MCGNKWKQKKCVKPTSSHGLTNNLSISSFDSGASFKVPGPKPQTLGTLGHISCPNFGGSSWSRGRVKHMTRKLNTHGGFIQWGIPKTMGFDTKMV